MWMEKLASGVLRVLTPLGPRFIQLTFWQRVYLLWVFRYFHTLPPKVLTGWQRRVIDQLFASEQFISVSRFDDAPVIGTLESRPLAQVSEGSVAARAADAVSAFAEFRQRP